MAGAEGHKDHRRQYWMVFLWLFILTALEVALTKIPISNATMIWTMCGLAVAKAGMVGLYYMHLNAETKWLKLTVAIPLALPVLYALALIAESAWRMIRNYGAGLA